MRKVCMVTMFVHGPHTVHVDDDSYSGSDNEENAEDIVQVGHRRNDCFALDELLGGHLSLRYLSHKSLAEFFIKFSVKYAECCWKNLIKILYLRN